MKLKVTYQVSRMNEEQLAKKKEKDMANLLKISEKQIQKSCIEYLQYLENLGKLMFLRLNSGNMFMSSGSKRYKIKLCKEGTADLMLIIKGVPIFVELKTISGKQSSHQIDFEKLAHKNGVKYCLIRSVDAFTELVNLLIATIT